ncbi:phospholipase D-like domain-containing protein, partial [Methylicorpusculum sp.]|uniref:phospholipase D-like domain-containing protein n=1 Tax=Methylicorpusculum sp. TaxID=2713644 RepID=UPI002ABB45EB
LTVSIDTVSMQNLGVYFLPQDKDTVAELLPATIEKTEHEALVASYFITDETVLDKLIALKKRGCDVHVIMDITSYDIERVVKRLLNADIIPIPSVRMLMHNKFLVSDNARVWTGSANFTATALEQAHNFENMLSITSPEIAQHYRTNFFAMEQEIFKTYATWLQGKWTTPKIPVADALLATLIPLLHEKNERFKKICDDSFRQSELADTAQAPHPSAGPSNQYDAHPNGAQANPAHTDNTLESAIAHTAPNTAPKPLSLKQNHMLRQRGVNGTGLTSREAYIAIGYLLEQEQLEKEEAELADTIQQEHLEKKNTKRACPNESFLGAH